MTSMWHADVTNDPGRDYELCIEIYEGVRHRGTLSREESGEVVLLWFAAATSLRVPAAWLAGVLQRAEEELPKHS